ncbi:MAG: hypothetical protein IJW69_02175, partial [Clostridia bacterium]|nr:hypothetical protein [Clostridia bacterium]
MKKSSTRIALVLVALVMLFTLLAVSASAALVNTTATIETARGQENYTLFNSGITGSGRPGNSSNSNCKSLTNNGKDLYCTYNATIQLGLPFKLNYDLTEKATLTIRSYDVDEYYSYSSPERDLVYLVDETAGTRKQLPGYLKGMNEQWNTTVFEIDPSWFVKG